MWWVKDENGDMHSMRIDRERKKHWTEIYGIGLRRTGGAKQRAKMCIWLFIIYAYCFRPMSHVHSFWCAVHICQICTNSNESHFFPCHHSLSISNSLSCSRIDFVCIVFSTKLISQPDKIDILCASFFFEISIKSVHCSWFDCIVAIWVGCSQFGKNHHYIIRSDRITIGLSHKLLKCDRTKYNIKIATTIKCRARALGARWSNGWNVIKLRFIIQKQFRRNAFFVRQPEWLIVCSKSISLFCESFRSHYIRCIFYFVCIQLLMPSGQPVRVHTYVHTNNSSLTQNVPMNQIRTSRRPRSCRP